MLRSWKFVLVPIVALTVLGAAPTFPAQSPERPRVFLDTTYSPPTRGRLLSVRAGGDLQAALHASQPGDVIELQAGATFTGNFTLPRRAAPPGSTFVARRMPCLPQPGTRVLPSHARLMPKIVPQPGAGRSGLPLARTTYGSSGSRSPRRGATRSTGPTRPTTSCLSGGRRGADLALRRYRPTSSSTAATSTAPPTGNVRRASPMNSARTAVVDSYLSDFHEVGADSQAIAVLERSGPLQDRQQLPRRSGREHHVRRRRSRHSESRALRHRDPPEPLLQAAVLEDRASDLRGHAVVGQEPASS